MSGVAPEPARAADVTTPLDGRPGLLAGPRVPALAARAGAALGSLLGRPVRLFGTVVAARHADVLELLARDLDFRIGPVNEAKIDAVNGGPFVLGMDRGHRLAREREALYRALAQVDLVQLRHDAATDIDRHLAAAGSEPGSEIDVVAAYARPVAAHTAQRLIGIGDGIDPALFKNAVRAVFAHTFLNQTDDAAVAAWALRAGGLMRGWLEAEIARRHEHADDRPDMMGALLRNPALDDDTVRRTLGGMLVGSIDTTASSVAKIMTVLAADRSLADRVESDLDCPERLAGWCHEVLRRWPHNPIVLRQAAGDTVFNGVQVRRGDRMVAWTQAAMLDPTVFPRPALLRPDRPGGTYLHFGGGLHPCAGRAINAFQIPMLVGALLRRGIVAAGRITWAGPFPDRLPVTLRSTMP